MFTGIVEAMGRVRDIKSEGTNKHFVISSPISHELKIDQSLSHNGVCLTVVHSDKKSHTVTAVQETLERSNLGDLNIGDQINLERAMVAGARLDGHLVQGHVDLKAECMEILDQKGSWTFGFKYIPSPEHILVDKGSICINGVSLTVVNPEKNMFSVAIIPFTFENTNFKDLSIGDKVNLEFDIIGKYITRYLQLYPK